MRRIERESLRSVLLGTQQLASRNKIVSSAHKERKLMVRVRVRVVLTRWLLLVPRSVAQEKDNRNNSIDGKEQGGEKGNSLTGSKRLRINITGKLGDAIDLLGGKGPCRPMGESSAMVSCVSVVRSYEVSLRLWTVSAVATRRRTDRAVAMP